jgi:hypothetical protein
MPIFLESKINLDGRTLRRYGPCKMQSQPPASRLPASIHTEIAKERTTTDRRVIHPNRSLRPLRSLCENPDQKRRSTRRSQRSQKNRQRRIEGSYHPNRSLRSLCENPDQKRPSTRRSQRSRRNDNSELKGHPIRIGLCDLCALCVKIRSEGHPHGDRKDRKGTGNHESKGHPIRIGLATFAISL